MKVDEFDYILPESLIAQVPLENRSKSRLLVLNQLTDEIAHKQFEDLIQYLEPGDLLIGNNSKVIPARLYAFKQNTLAKIEVLLLHQVDSDEWEVLVRPAKKVKTGTILEFKGKLQSSEVIMTGTIIKEGDMGIRRIVFQYQGDFQFTLSQIGELPLPPYIHEKLPDQGRYQTVFAKTPGSVAAPTAGLHFTEDYLNFLQQRGVNIAYVTLHVGIGTFRPVIVDSIEEHKMHAEFYHIPSEVSDLIQHTRQKGKRVIAIGTTVARTLESSAKPIDSTDTSNETQYKVESSSGWTDIFIYPGYQFRIVDALITNFHLPKSTLLMMISAMAGKDKIMRAYQEAIDKKYRFFSFGDAMLITK